MPFYSGSYCPIDNNFIVCSGHKTLKFYKIEQSEFKTVAISLGKREPSDYTCHAWDSERRLLIATEQSEVLVFDGSEFKGVFDTQFPQPIVSIATFSKGFICGCESGIVLVFERGDDKELYKRINKLSIPQQPHSIIHLAVTPSEETLACVLSNHQIYSLNLSQIEVLKDNDPNDPNFHLLLPTFHHKGIGGLDLSVRKPYIVTCGRDKTIKVWNWHDKSVVITKEFKEDPVTVAMHPSGLHVAVGFSDKLRYAYFFNSFQKNKTYTQVFWYVSKRMGTLLNVYLLCSKLLCCAIFIQKKIQNFFDFMNT